MSNEIEVQATYVEEMRFDLATENGHTVPLDGNYIGGASPMQMVLISLAGCSGMSVVSVLRKKRQRITQYTVHVKGICATTYPLVFTQITVAHRVSGQALDAKAVQRAIELAETRYCPVSIMLSQVVNLVHTFTIIEA